MKNERFPDNNVYFKPFCDLIHLYYVIQILKRNLYQELAYAQIATRKYRYNVGIAILFYYHLCIVQG